VEGSLITVFTTASPTGPYAKPFASSPHSHMPLLIIRFNIILLSTPGYLK